MTFSRIGILREECLRSLWLGGGGVEGDRTISLKNPPSKSCGSRTRCSSNPYVLSRGSPQHPQEMLVSYESYDRFTKTWAFLSLTSYLLLVDSFLFLPPAYITHAQSLWDCISTLSQSNYHSCHSFFELSEAIFWTELNTNGL